MTCAARSCGSLTRSSRRTPTGTVAHRRHPPPRRGARPAAARADERAARHGGPARLVDISFYRDDLAIRPSAPVVHATQLDFPVDGRTIVIVDDVLYTGPHGARRDRRDLRLRPPGAGAARGARRPRPPRAPDPARLRRQEPPDLARTSASTSASRRSTAATRSRSARPTSRSGRRHEHESARHLISIEDLDRAGIERILDRAESFAEVSGREIKKVPALRGRTVVNLFYEASHADQLELRARGQAAQRRRRQHPLAPARASTRASRSRTPCRRCRPTTRRRS